MLCFVDQLFKEYISDDEPCGQEGALNGLDAFDDTLFDQAFPSDVKSSSWLTLEDSSHTVFTAIESVDSESLDVKVTVKSNCVSSLDDAHGDFVIYLQLFLFTLRPLDQGPIYTRLCIFLMLCYICDIM